MIQDPVGAPGHYNHGGFYDTFIKENDIRFKENGDWVDKDRLTVYRDVDIYIGFGNDWGMMVQPAILMYVFDEDLKVKNLKAHWNMLWSCELLLEKQCRVEILRLASVVLNIRLCLLDPHLDESPVLDFAKYGVGASRNFVRVFTNHGASFGYKYVKGLLAGYFSGGAACARQLAKAIRTNKNKAVTKLFESGSSVIELPGNVVATPATLLDELASSSVSKIHVSKVYESGYTTACRIDVHAGKEVKQGVALFGISDKKISNLTMYWD